MSLLEIARGARIRTQGVEQTKDLITLVVQDEQAGKAWKAEEEKRKVLQLEIRATCTNLLVRHGVSVPDFKGSLKIIRPTWNRNGRYLSEKIEEGEESISVSILSESPQPAEGKMRIKIDGWDTSLELSPTRPAVLCKDDGTPSWKSATSMELSGYKDVLGLVKEKFQPTPKQAPR